MRETKRCHDCGAEMEEGDGDGYYCSPCIHQHEIDDAIDRGSDLMMAEFEKTHPDL